MCEWAPLPELRTKNSSKVSLKAGYTAGVTKSFMPLSLRVR